VINMDKSKNFIEDINEQTKTIINQIKKETETYEKDEINIFKSGLEKEIDSYYEGELNDLRLQAQTNISQNKLSSKRKLLKIRSDLANKIFNETEQRLLTFTSSEEYRSHLKNKLQKHEVDYQDGFFEVKGIDVGLFSELLKELGLTNEIKIGNIKLGGFRFISLVDHIEIDETLDTHLLEQEAWFMDHSGFIL